MPMSIAKVVSDAEITFRAKPVPPHDYLGGRVPPAPSVLGATWRFLVDLGQDKAQHRATREISNSKSMTVPGFKREEG